jgi:hypothetical protein
MSISRAKGLNQAVTDQQSIIRVEKKHLYAIRGIATVGDLFPHNEMYALLFIMEWRRLGNDYVQYTDLDGLSLNFLVSVSEDVYRRSSAATSPARL